MKKFLMAVFALAVAASVATAGVGIGWTTLYGAYDHEALDTTGGSNALLDSYGALWQLIYAGVDNVANAIDDPMNPVDPIAWAANDYLAGDDVLWAQRTIPMGGGAAPEDGTTWDNWMINQTGTVVYEDLAWNTAGFVYQRVFEGTSPQGSSWFFETGLLALDVGYVGGGAPTQPFPLDSFSAGFQPGSQVVAIPEPATMGLLGLGALVMALRRRRS